VHENSYAINDSPIEEQGQQYKDLLAETRRKLAEFEEGVALALEEGE